MRTRLSAAGLHAPIEFFRAVDGLEVSERSLQVHGISLFEGWRQPDSLVHYHARDLKPGEIGCAMSHWLLWRRIADDGLRAALILEDDVLLAPGFGASLGAKLEELAAAMPDWDLCYAGRRRITVPPFVEPPVPEEPEIAEGLVAPGFSYCTHAYVISAAGARRLLDAGFERHLVPVDEFIPALYARHPRGDVRTCFGEGDRLHAAAIVPDIAFQDGQGSDTEALLPPLGITRGAATPATGLDALVPVLGARRFLADRWPEHAHVEHGPVERLALPRALFDLERMVRAPEVRISLFGPDGFRASAANAGDALAFYEAGMTLYLVGLERSFPELRAWCRSLGAALDVDPAHIFVEGFASPAAGTGSSMHYDFDVNFNVQLAGEKVFRYAPNPQVVNPLRSLAVKKGERPMNPFDGSPLPARMPRGAKRARMKPGSVIFLPRGCWHETVVQSASLAIAFVVKPPPLYSLFLRELTQRLTRSAPWRAYALGKNRARVLAEALASLPEMVSSIRPETILSNVVRARWPEGAQRRLEPLRRPHGADHWLLVVETAGEATELPVADALAPLVRWMVDQDASFSTEGMMTACPGIPPELARNIVTYLANTGLLEQTD